MIQETIHTSMTVAVIKTVSLGLAFLRFRTPGGGLEVWQQVTRGASAESLHPDPLTYSSKPTPMTSSSNKTTVSYSSQRIPPIGIKNSDN